MILSLNNLTNNEQKTYIYLGYPATHFFGLRNEIKEAAAGDEVLDIVVGDRSTDDFALTTQDVQLQNGVLYFKDSATLQHVLRSLESLSRDQAFSQNHLASQGVTVLNSPADFAYNYDPASHAFALRFPQFKSLHMFNEDIEYQHLQGGGDVETLPEGKIDDYELERVVNQYGEIKVGKLIYRYINDEIFLVITNSDWAQVQALRSHPDISNVSFQKNVRRIDTYVEEDVMRYNKIVNMSKGGPVEDGCDMTVVVSKISETTYKAKNASLFYDCEDTGALWRVVDGNYNLLYTTSGVDEITFSPPANVILPVSVFMIINTECCKGTVNEILIPQDCSAVQSSTISLIMQRFEGGDDVKFTLSGIENLGVDYSIRWTYIPLIGDVDITNNENSIRKKFDLGNHQTICVTAEVDLANGCHRQFYLCATIGCGLKKKKEKTSVLLNSPFDGNYKFKFKLSIAGDMNIVAQSNFFMKNPISEKWEKASAQELSVVVPPQSRYLDRCVDHVFSPFTRIRSDVSELKVSLLPPPMTLLDNQRKIRTYYNLTHVTFSYKHLDTYVSFPLHLYGDF